MKNVQLHQLTPRWSLTHTSSPTITSQCHAKITTTALHNSIIPAPLPRLDSPQLVELPLVLHRVCSAQLDSTQHNYSRFAAVLLTNRQYSSTYYSSITLRVRTATTVVLPGIQPTIVADPYQRTLQNRCGKNGLPKKASFRMRPVKPIMAIRPRVTSNCRSRSRETMNSVRYVHMLMVQICRWYTQ